MKKYLNACYATGELQSVLNNYNSARLNKIFFEGDRKETAAALSETEINAGFNLNVVAAELNVEVDKILCTESGNRRRTPEKRRKSILSSCGSDA